MVCEHCGTVFCWDEADVGSLGGSRKRFCSKNCEVRESDKRTGYRRRYAANQRRIKLQLEACQARGKKRYKTAVIAKNTAIRLYHENGWRLFPYECPCGWWHLTSEKPDDVDEKDFFAVYESPAFRHWETRSAGMK